MARRRRYRRYRRSAKWAANLQEINTTTIQAAANDQFYSTFVLAFNPTQLNTSVSQVFTVKNLEVNFYIDTSSNGKDLEDIAAYIMFVPQGMTVGLSYNLDHPEYIMAYKYLGSPSYESNNAATVGQQYQPARVRTRLSRKLQSGDNVILFIKGSNLSQTETASFDVHGLVRWWTKAN